MRRKLEVKRLNWNWNEWLAKQQLQWPWENATERDPQWTREGEQAELCSATMCSVTGVCVWGPVCPAVALSLSLTHSLALALFAFVFVLQLVKRLWGWVLPVSALASLPTSASLKSRLFIEIENEATQQGRQRKQMLLPQRLLRCIKAQIWRVACG